MFWKQRFRRRSFEAGKLSFFRKIYSLLNRKIKGVEYMFNKKLEVIIKKLRDLLNREFFTLFGEGVMKGFIFIENGGDLLNCSTVL